MPRKLWRTLVNLERFWHNRENDPPMNHREEIAEALRASEWPQITSNPRQLDHLLKGFANPDEADPELWWHGLYNLADNDRVWLDLDGVETRRQAKIKQAMQFFARVRIEQRADVHAAEVIENDPKADLRTACAQTGHSSSARVEVLDDFDAEVTCSSCRDALKGALELIT